MTRVRKAAMVLLSLDKTQAAKVMSKLTHAGVSALTAEIARLEQVSDDEQSAAIEEFCTLGIARVSVEQHGKEKTRELLSQSFGDEQAAKILEALPPTATHVPFGFLRQADPESFLPHLVEEHPQTIALVMSHLPAEKSAAVLAQLPAEKQLEVVRRVAGSARASDEIVREVEKSLAARMRSVTPRAAESPLGVSAVVEMLTVADPQTNQNVLAHLKREHPELVQKIRRRMLAFDDLSRCATPSLKILWRAVDTQLWTLALVGASNQLKSKLMAALSPRDAQCLVEEMQYLGPVRISDVEAAQQRILEAFHRLEQSGEVLIDDPPPRRKTG